jgi:hypothetical protein
MAPVRPDRRQIRIDACGMTTSAAQSGSGDGRWGSHSLPRHQGWRRQAEGRPRRPCRNGSCDPALERSAIAGLRHVVVAHDPGALLAGTPWLDVFCPGCGTSRAIDLRTLDRHPLASAGTLVLGLRCSRCPGSAPMPKLLGLYALPPAAAARARARPKGGDGSHRSRRHLKGSSRRSPMPRKAKPQTCQAAA